MIPRDPSHIVTYASWDIISPVTISHVYGKAFKGYCNIFKTNMKLLKGKLLDKFVMRPLITKRKSETNLKDAAVTLKC